MSFISTDSDFGRQIDLTDALRNADEECVDGNETAGVRGLDVTLAELGREAFEEDLFVAQQKRKCESHWTVPSFCKLGGGAQKKGGIGKQIQLVRDE